MFASEDGNADIVRQLLENGEVDLTDKVRLVRCLSPLPSSVETSCNGLDGMALLQRTRS